MGGEEQQAFCGRAELFIFSEVQNQTSVFLREVFPSPPTPLPRNSE